MNAKHKKTLKFLNFSDSWYFTSFLNIINLDVLYNEYIISEDKSKEHYRYMAFLEILNKKEFLSDDEFYDYLKLIETESDSQMSASVLKNLMQWNNLSEQQFKYLKHHDFFKIGGMLYPSYERQQIIMKINSGLFTEELFQYIIEYGDRNIQLETLDKCILTDNQLRILIERGVNKEVRHKANLRLKNSHK